MIANSDELTVSEAHEVALSCLEAGVAAALPRSVVDRTISRSGDRLTIGDTDYDLDTYERIVVVGGGNAAGHFAAALEPILGESLDHGVVVTDAPADTRVIGQIEGAHPVPNSAGERGAQAVLEAARQADEETLVLAIITGGGSALLPAPTDDVSLDDLRSVTDALVRSGATIEEINAVRKHLSNLKGGHLARAASPAHVVGLVMSDVVGNRLDVIASGPVSPDESTFDDAVAVVETHDIDLPAAVAAHLQAGTSGAVPETPGPGDPVFDRVSVHVLADGMTSLQAAAEAASDHEYQPLILSSRIRGEARESAKTHVGIAEEAASTGHPLSPPTVLVSGGETTVSVTGDGAGGPNQEFCVSAALELSRDDVCVAAVDTDGVDGATDAAGAIVTAATAEPPDEARAALASNDVYPFLAARDALIETGATGTNVNDLRVFVIESR